MKYRSTGPRQHNILQHADNTLKHPQHPSRQESGRDCCLGISICRRVSAFMHTLSSWVGRRHNRQGCGSACCCYTAPNKVALPRWMMVRNTSRAPVVMLFNTATTRVSSTVCKNKAVEKDQQLSVVNTPRGDGAENTRACTCEQHFHDQGPLPKSITRIQGSITRIHHQVSIINAPAPGCASHLALLQPTPGIDFSRP